MFYGPSPTKLAVSYDFGDWFGQEIRMNGNPPMACHRDHFVLKIGENHWLMYVTGMKCGKSSIACMESFDLLSLDFVGYALTSGENSELNPSWGAFESPFVFFSEDSRSFGCYDGLNGSEGFAKPVTRLRCHAPEIVREDDKWYITTCGWRESSLSGGKVMIAGLDWEE